MATECPNRNRNRLMPSVAEPDITIDMVTSVARMSGVHDIAGQTFLPRPGLATRTLGLIGLDAAVTACAAILCFEWFNPQRALTESASIIPIICLTVCVSLSFFERGLYAPADIMSRQLKGRRLALAWLQAIAVGTLLNFCLA